jgi:hypothetical protein
MLGFLLASFFFLLRTVSSQTVSIQYVSAYTSQRECAFACQGINPNDADVIANALSCDTEPIENSCFCRSDLQAEAENYISTCVQRMCSNTQDATSAVSIYDAYCTSAGFLKAAGNTGMPTSLFSTPATVVPMVEIMTIRSLYTLPRCLAGFWWNFLFLAGDEHIVDLFISCDNYSQCSGLNSDFHGTYIPSSSMSKSLHSYE